MPSLAQNDVNICRQRARLAADCEIVVGWRVKREGWKDVDPESLAETQMKAQNARWFCC